MEKLKAAMFFWRKKVAVGASSSSSLLFFPTFIHLFFFIHLYIYFPPLAQLFLKRFPFFFLNGNAVKFNFF